MSFPILQHNARRYEPGRTPTAPGLELRALQRPYSVLLAPGQGSAGHHRLGAGTVQIREQPQRRNRKDAIRPLLHQASLAGVRSPHSLRHNQNRPVRIGISRGRRGSGRRDGGQGLDRAPSGGGKVNESRLTARIRDRTARIAIIGQGYVGLPLAVEFGRNGFSVVGVDTDLDRVGALQAGQSCTPDLLSEDLIELIQQGRYEATADSSALERADVVIICVPTPLRKSKDPDISFVIAAGTEVAAHYHPGQLVILESTTYPETTEGLLLPIFRGRGAKVGEDFFLAFSPERIDPANPTFKVKDIPKVVGGVTAACTRLAATLYGQIVPRIHEVSSPKVAELAKLYENVFRNVNIALANEFALMCRRLGVSTKEVIDAAATKPFGFMPFYPGPGIGGHCIPLDPFYLSWKMRLNGYEPRFIHLADEINRAMPDYVVELVGNALNQRRRCLNGARVLALGVAYKREVGDTRESPAIEILMKLREKGCEVSYVDPYVPTLNLHGTTLKSVDLTDEELADADCVVILTDHSAFDYQQVVDHARLVVDPRNATWGLPVSDDRVVRL